MRHLVLPDDLSGTGQVLSSMASEISPNTYVNLMDQYHPCFRVHDQPPMNRRLTAQEWRRARDLAKQFGLS